MAQWGEIKQNFIDWLKTQDVDYKDSERGIAHIKYKDQFKLFIEKHDGDDNLNMDSFTKTKDGDNTLAEDMVRDYVANLDKDDKAFAALDTDGDGVISNNETNAFINRSIEAGFDDNADDFSFDDFVTAVNKINTDDTGFLTGNNNGNNAAGAAGNGANANGANGNNGANANGANGNNGANANGANGNNGNDGKGAGDGTGNIPQVPNIEVISSNIQKHDIRKVENPNVTVDSFTADNSVLNFNVEGADIDSLNNARDAICTGIKGAKSDFEQYSDIYTNTNDFYQQAGEYIEANNAEYNSIINELAQSNENVRVANENISTCETALAAHETLLNQQLTTKDMLAMSIQSTDAQIASVSAQISAADEDTDISGLQATLASLEDAKAQLEAELNETAQQILETQEQIEITRDNLNQAYENMEIALSDVSASECSKIDILRATVENKKNYNQLKCNLLSAKAGMAATDAYIISLEGKLEEVDAAIEKAPGGKAPEAADTGEDLIYPPNVEGISQFVGMTPVGEPQRNEDGQIVYTCKTAEGETVTVTCNEDGSFSVDYALGNATLGLKVDSNNDAQLNRNGKTSYVEDSGNGARKVIATDASGATVTTEINGDDVTETKEYPNGDKVITKIVTEGDTTTRITETHKDGKVSFEEVKTIKEGENKTTTTLHEKDGDGNTVKNVTVETENKGDKVTTKTTDHTTGDITEEVNEYNSDGVLIRQTTTKKEDGNENPVEIKTTTIEEKDGKTITTTQTEEYEYDEEGNIISARTIKEVNDGETVTTTYHYNYETEEGEDVHVDKDENGNWTYTRYGNAEEKTEIRFEGSSETDIAQNTAILIAAYCEVEDAPTNGTVTTFDCNGKEYELKYENGAWQVSEKAAEPEAEDPEADPE